jgi:hypothetical protein
MRRERGGRVWRERGGERGVREETGGRGLINGREGGAEQERQEVWGKRVDKRRREGGRDTETSQPPKKKPTKSKLKHKSGAGGHKT